MKQNRNELGILLGKDMKKKIGILTYHRSINYGAFLQAYSLYNVIQKRYGDKWIVEIIDYESEKAYKVYAKQFGKKGIYKKFKKNINELKKTKTHIKSDSLDIVFKYIKMKKYDCVVVGSDEIWKIDGMRGFPNAYWLNGDIGDTVKVSYAASSRNCYEKLTDLQRDYIRESLSTFDYIGVRDISTKTMLSNITNKNINLNCDPVFLYDFGYDSTYRSRLIKKYKIDEQKKLMIVMIPDNRLVQLLSRYFDDMIIISLYDYNSFADFNLTDIDPFEWIKVISVANFMVTNRFHGVSFAMKYNIPFLALDNYDVIENSKIYDLLNRCNLEEHYCEYQGYQTDENRKRIINRIDSMLLKNFDYSDDVLNLVSCSESFMNMFGEL